METCTTMPSEITNDCEYEKFDPIEFSKLALNYLTSMVDKKKECLPYWLIAPHENPAFARHCRVDDAELLASWYEGIDAVRSVLGTDQGREVQDAFYEYLLNRSWGEHGLRFNHDYPWSPTNHSSFHEMGYVLSALVRILQDNPNDKLASKRAFRLVEGMRKLVICREKKVFWSGDFAENELLLEFPNDIYLKNGGFDQTKHTGRGEHSIRAAVLLHPLVCYWELTGHENALELARGIANHLLGPSRYFNYKMEFFGHVHSSVWFASGLIRLGRILENDSYIEKGKNIYDYVRSLSSSFGWVPEYTQWHPLEEEHCETCCIKSMIQCAFELVDSGYDSYWNDINLFARNHLMESQIKDGCFVATDNTIKDTMDTTYHNIDKRIVGGFSGGSEPNSISLQRFRSIAGCCVGTAPQAMEMVWNRAVELDDLNNLFVNIPLDKSASAADVLIGYPNDGTMVIRVKASCNLNVRIYPWMKCGLKYFVNNKSYEPQVENSVAVFCGIMPGDIVHLKCQLELTEIPEIVKNKEFRVCWKGCDVVDIQPYGEPLRLYQRKKGVSREYPQAPKHRTEGKGFVAAPTEKK